MKIDIDAIIDNVRKRRTIFTSEADFQLEMAWAIKEMYPNALVRMEYCPDFAPSMHIDILVVIDGGWIPIELKYKTKRSEKVVNGEKFFLKEHSAKDVNCYLYLKDLQRVEFIKENADLFLEGYTVFLTNEQSYLKAPHKKDCVYKDFSLEEGTVKTGILKWGENAGTGTMKGNEKPIELTGSYTIQWQEYSVLDDSNTGSFFVLTNTVL